MKKLLLLGAMQMHFPIIQRAKQRGVYVITCDYLPENLGHKLADEAYYDSTTDKEAVLALAKRLNVDAVMTFNSDPAALTAAYVSEVLGLRGSGLKAVEIMSQKDKFRTFLKENSFNVPYFKEYQKYTDLLMEIDNFSFPVMIKPVDSSGSKGVAKIERKDQILTSFETALSYSRCKRVIVEEFIEAEGPQLHGDGFVNQNGELDFIYLGDHHFEKSINNLVPISTTFPSVHTESNVARVVEEVRRFIRLVGFNGGGINIEARISKNDGKVYLIEVGPRNGGNFTPIVIQYASGYSFIDASLDYFLNLESEKKDIQKHGWYAYMIIHSDRDGHLNDIEIDCTLKEKVLEMYHYIDIGGKVHSFRGANAAIGVLLVRFQSMNEMHHYVNNMNRYIKVVLDNE